MKTKQRLMSAAMVAAGTMLCRVLFAADVAFYPFTEGNDGDNAVGAALLKVDVGAHEGVLHAGATHLLRSGT